MDTLGWLLVKSGENKRGVALLRRAVQNGAATPEIRYHLASALARSAQDADREQAREIVASLLESEGDFDHRAEVKALADKLGQAGAPAGG